MANRGPAPYTGVIADALGIAQHRGMRGMGVPVAQYSSLAAFEESVGKPSQAPNLPPQILTVSDAGAYQITGLNRKVAIRFGISVEMLVREARAANVFICHPDDVSFDCMDLSLTGRTGMPSNEIPWVAQAQLVQRFPGGKQRKISGAFQEQSHDELEREPTQLAAFSEDTITEFSGGYIEKPWPLFLNMEVFRVLGDAALPAEIADLRFQVTVNLVSQNL